LVELRWLSLAKNNLATLPPTIGELPHLTYLSMDHNNLRIIPDELSQLTALKELHLAYNSFEIFSVPFQGKELITLDLSHNQVTKISPLVIEQLARQQHFEELLLEYNQLSVLPEGIEKCVHLRRLNISHNQLIKLPDDLGCLEFLKEFRFDNNFLKYPPKTVLDAGKDAVLNYLRNKRKNKAETSDPTMRSTIYHLAVLYGILPEDFEVNSAAKKNRRRR